MWFLCLFRRKKKCLVALMSISEKRWTNMFSYGQYLEFWQEVYLQYNIYYITKHHFFILIIVPVYSQTRSVALYILTVRSMSYLSSHYRFDLLTSMHVLGLGFVTSITFIFLVGVFMSSWLGASVLGLGEWFIKRMPFVRHIYNASKQSSSAISPGVLFISYLSLVLTEWI